MKSSRFSETQRRAIVDSQKSKTVDSICQEYQISPGTFYKWKESFSIQNNEDKKRLRELEKENEQLKNGAARADVRRIRVRKACDQRCIGDCKKACSSEEKDQLLSQTHLKHQGLSLRKLCKFLVWRRQTVYARRHYKPQQAKETSDRALVELYKSVRQDYIAWGFAMIYAYLRNKGHIFCKKRGHRLYRQAQLSLYKKPQKARIRREFRDLLPPNFINEGWAMDFLSEVIIEPTQQWVRIINIVDECSRKGLWVEAHEHIKAIKLTEILDKLVVIRGQPAYIRTDNGPEFISDELAKWATKNGIELRFIQPGKPTQNGIIERLNGTLRRECLNLNWFYSLSELNQHLDKWYYAYNFDRPHKSINYLTPDAFEKKNQSIYYKMVASENR